MSTPTQRKRPLAIEEVPSADYLAVLWKHLRKALCEEVFTATRIDERQRKWMLFALIWFWISLLKSGYSSQTRALLEARAARRFSRW